MRTAFKRLLNQAVTLEAYTGPSENGGRPTFATPSTLSRCRVEPLNRVVRKSDGAEVVSTATVYVGDDGVSINPEDRITLPDGTQRQVVEAAKLYDTDGATVHHLEVAVL